MIRDEAIKEIQRILDKLWPSLCKKCNVKECSLMDCKTRMQFQACKEYCRKALSSLESKPELETATVQCLSGLDTLTEIEVPINKPEPGEFVKQMKHQLYHVQVRDATLNAVEIAEKCLKEIDHLTAVNKGSFKEIDSLGASLMDKDKEIAKLKTEVEDLDDEVEELDEVFNV